MSEANWNLNHKDLLLTILLILVIPLAFFILPETIPAGKGFGYDGVMYAKMVIEIDNMISNGELSAYYSQRILPALLVRSGLMSLGLPLEANYVIWGFRALNFTLILISLAFWLAIAQRIGITRTAYWIGVLGLFFCFPNAKEILYHPVRTDHFAFMLGLALAWSYVTKQLLAIAFFSIVGAFVWQISGIVGLALILSTLIEPGDQHILTPKFIKNSYKKINRFTIIASLSLATIIALPDIFGIDLQPLISWRSFANDPFTRFLTNIPVLTLVSLFIIRLYADTFSSGWKRSTKLASIAKILILIIVILILPKTILTTIENPKLPLPGMNGSLDILRELLVGRVREGMIFLPFVAHSVYYGPVFILFILMWKECSKATVNIGLGFVIAASIFAVMSIFSESRFNFMLWPFVVIITTKALSQLRINKITNILIAATAIGLSKAWFVINQDEWPLPDYSALYESPKSLYFAHHGPWMSVENYILQGSILIVLYLAFFMLLRNSRSNQLRSESKDKP